MVVVVVVVVLVVAVVVVVVVLRSHFGSRTQALRIPCRHTASQFWHDGWLQTGGVVGDNPF